jgi:CheY-like chemotaxis protein
MAIFRRPRRQRTGVPPRPAPSEPPAERTASAGERLRQRLREIASAAAAPEDAIEPALHAILEASGTKAGALCLFDQRYGLLRLAAEVGLSDEGCRRLRSVRRADPTAWDIPLGGLLNRRAYLIESPSRNRYVPRLFEPIVSVRTIACVPLYAGPTPVGSLILVAVAPRSLGERDVRMLERALGELARMVEAARRRAGGADASPPPALPSPRAEAVAMVAERDRLRADAEEQRAERDRLRADAEEQRAERDRLRAALQSATEERVQLAARLERTRDEAERERARLEQARATAEREAVEAAAGLESARGEIERLRARLAEADTAAARERELGRERAREEEERIASELRAAAAREQRLREELQAAAERVEGQDEDTLRRAHETARAADEASAAAAAEARAAWAALASTQAVVEALEEEANRAHVEIERLAGAEQTARVERERLERAVAQQAREAAALRDERDRAVAAAREGAAERAELAAQLQTFSAEGDRLRVSLAAAAAEKVRLEAALGREGAERERLGAALAASAPAEAGPSAPEAPEPVRVVTVAAPGGARIRNVEPGRLVAVLDVDEAWAAGPLRGQVAVVAPGADVAECIADTRPGRILVNLAAPGALEACAALRAARPGARSWGCIADAAAGRALGLGLIDVSSRPLDAEGVLAALGDRATRGTRVVTAGADVDALMSLRQALARRGMSVSMAWDAKQAAELLAVVHPEVVVVDLELPRRDGYEIVAQLAAATLPPAAVLVPGRDDAATCFAALLADQRHAARAIPLGELITAVLGRSEAPPAERRQKVRALTRK